MIYRKFSLHFSKLGFDLFQNEAKNASISFLDVVMEALRRADFAFTTKNRGRAYFWSFMDKSRVEDLRIISRCLQNLKYGDYFFYFNSVQVWVDYNIDNFSRLTGFLDDVERELRDVA